MNLHDPAEFRDRQDAGRCLAVALSHLAATNPLVLALPRGGVPVAAEVASALNADLDLLFVRKLGAPGQPELGIGAIVDGANPQIVLNEEIVRQLASPKSTGDASATWATICRSRSPGGQSSSSTTASLPAAL